MQTDGIWMKLLQKPSIWKARWYCILSCNSTWPTHLERQQVQDSCQKQNISNQNRCGLVFIRKVLLAMGCPCSDWFRQSSCQSNVKSVIKVLMSQMMVLMMIMTKSYWWGHHLGSRCHRECYEWWTIPREIWKCNRFVIIHDDQAWPSFPKYFWWWGLFQMLDNHP